jgi:hypothetical protein
MRGRFEGESNQRRNLSERLNDMNAFIKFNKGVMTMPIYGRLWLMLLIAVNLFVPLFFLDRLEAQIVVGTMLVSMIFMTILTRASGFTRLLGLGHILWFPLLYFLWIRLDQIPVEYFFGIWVRALIAFNAVSLVIDVVDVIRYIVGDRNETVKGY